MTPWMVWRQWLRWLSRWMLHPSFRPVFFHKTPLKTKECPREKSGKLEDAFPTEIVTFVSFRGCMNAVHRRWLIQMSQENPYVKKKNGPSRWSRRKNWMQALIFEDHLCRQPGRKQADSLKPSNGERLPSKWFCKVPKAPSPKSGSVFSLVVGLA